MALYNSFTLPVLHCRVKARLDHGCLAAAWRRALFRKRPNVAQTPVLKSLLCLTSCLCSRVVCVGTYHPKASDDVVEFTVFSRDVFHWRVKAACVLSATCTTILFTMQLKVKI